MFVQLSVNNCELSVDPTLAAKMYYGSYPVMELYHHLFSLGNNMNETFVKNGMKKKKG